MIILAAVALLAGIAGVAFVVKGVSEVTEDIKPAIPIMGIALGLFALVYFMKSTRE